MTSTLQVSTPVKFHHFTTCKKAINKIVKQASSTTRMINPCDLIEGKEYLSSVSCKGCGLIPSDLDKISYCMECDSIICDKCFNLSMLEVIDNILEW